jgi:hypothetical protein
MGVKKSGYNLDRSTQEKVTDGVRDAFEKATGYVLLFFFFLLIAANWIFRCSKKLSENISN